MTLNFNDAIFAQEALQAFTAKLLPIKAFSHSFSAEASRKGNAVYVPLVNNVTATTFNQSYIGTGGQIDVLTINLTQQKISTVDITDVQMANSSAADFVNFARQQGKALAKLVLQDILSVVTTGAFGAAVVTTANVDRTQIRKIRKSLIQGNVDLDSVSLILNADAYDYLLSDTNIVQAMQYGGSEAIRDGKIPKVLGLPIFESNIVPTSGLSTLVGFAAHSDAVCVAMRYLEPQGPDRYESVQQVTDPETGMTIGYRRLFDATTGKAYASFEALYGYGVGITGGLKIVTSA
jgi:hypothetical protein